MPRTLTWGQCHRLAHVLRDRIQDVVGPQHDDILVYGVPRGGIHVAQMLALFSMTEDPKLATVIVDDVIDTGATRDRYRKLYPDTPFLTLVPEKPSEWVSFPWERMSGESGPEDNVVRMLQFIGEDPAREGLRDTPKRVVKSYSELYSGYKADPKSVLTAFADGACDEMVVLRDIEFYSTCEHHIQPFFGKAHIGYLPKGKVIGISKLARILEVYARRLQIQERIGQQVTAALMEGLDPLGAGCVIEAAHLCMRCRGVQKQNSVMVTSSLAGAFRDDPAVKSEFLRMIGR